MRRLIYVVRHERTEQHPAGSGSIAAVPPVASELVKAGGQVAVVVTMDHTMDHSAVPGGDGLPVPQADRA